MEARIFFTSDTHFGHDRDFVFAKRGFETVQEMNEQIVRNWNRVVRPGDTVYHLGDLYLLEDKNIEYVRRLAGNIHIIRGNHDTDNRINALLLLPNVKSVGWADMLHYGKYHFYLSHYPMLTCDIGITKGNVDKGLRNRTMCLYGHTHQETPFFNGKLPYIYNVGMDAHGCTPIMIDEIIEEMKVQHEILRRETGGRRFE